MAADVAALPDAVAEPESFEALRRELALKALFCNLPADELVTLLRQRDGAGATAIHRAVKAGDTARLAALVGADPGLLDLADSGGRKPLELAAALLQPAAAAALADHVRAQQGAVACAAAAAAALPRLLTQLAPAGSAPLAGLQPTLAVLLGAGAQLDARSVRVDCLGEQTLLCEALRWQQYEAAAALLAAGASAHVAEASVQPLHALAVGVLQPCGAYYPFRSTPQPLVPEAVLGAARQLLAHGAQLDAACTLAATTASHLKLRGRTALAYLCSGALGARGAAQQAALSLVDLLLLAGADPNARDQAENTPLHLAVTSLPGCSPQVPFLALLHRLLSAGADLAARNNSLVLPTSHTPLGSLLCSSGHAGLVQPAAVDAAAAMLAAGASVTDAGGGRAWRSVLTSAFWYSGGTVDRLAMLRLLLQHDVPGLRSADHQGRPPLAHLLEVAATDLAMNAFDAMEIRDVYWQLRPAAAERLHELVQLLLGAGADPSLLDAPAAEAGAAMLAATAEEDGSDDEDLHSDDEAAAAAGGNAAAAASALSHRRRAWCLRRLGNRLETANMCQSPLRLSIKLHDVGLTRALLGAGADAAREPGAGVRPLLSDVADEFGVLSHMLAFKPAERRAVLSWCTDTAEALAAAGAAPHHWGCWVAGQWAWPWLELLEGVLSGTGWHPDAHSNYPAPFRAAARTLLLINGARGFGGAARRRSRRVAAAQGRQAMGRGGAAASGSSGGGGSGGASGGGGGGVRLPGELVERILAEAARPLSGWLAMMDGAEF